MSKFTFLVLTVMNNRTHEADYPNEGLILAGAACPKRPDTPLLTQGYKFEQYTDSNYGIQPLLHIALHRENIIPVLQDVLAILPAEYVHVRFEEHNIGQKPQRVWQRYYLDKLVAQSILEQHQEYIVRDGYSVINLNSESTVDHTYIRLTREKVLLIYRDVRKQCIQVLQEHSIAYAPDVLPMFTTDCIYFSPENVDTLRTEFLEDIDAKIIQEK